MKNQNNSGKYLRILILSDLHFSGLPNVNVDDKSKTSKVAEKTAINLNQEFIQSLRKICQFEESYPDVVIVAGDLVNTGSKNEFAQAVEFIDTVVKEFKVGKHIYVVPGNHDVDWSANDYEAKFKNYSEATKEYITPKITKKEITTKHIDLSKIKDGINLELLLLASPTFSGAINEEREKIIKDIKNLLLKTFPTASEKPEIENFLKEISNIKEFLDIAAIGADQRRQIHKLERNNNDDNDIIRIAVLHHHLLPDPGLEISPFEAVLDSGKVLEDLINNRFDLVINGHKHRRRLAHYKLNNSKKRQDRKDNSKKHTNNSYIDVFTSPSLFRGNNSTPGFTILDIHAKNSPFYADISSYSTETAEPIGEKKLLVKEGRVLPETSEICAKISPEDQVHYLHKIIEHINNTLTWKESHPKIVNGELLELFNESFDYSLKALETMAEERIILKAPHAGKSWDRFISIANKKLNQQTLHVVSHNDMEYWKDSMIEKGWNDAKRYSKVLEKFEGEKKRVWILDKDKFDREKEKILKIAEHMKSMKFEVFLIYSEKTKFLEVNDFSIIGDLCISTWKDFEEGNRELVESFNKEEIKKRKREWELLMNSYDFQL